MHKLWNDDNIINKDFTETIIFQFTPAHLQHIGENASIICARNDV